MKNKDVIEVAERYFERSPLILTISILVTTALVGSCLYLFLYQEFEMHGWALVLAPPAMYSSFQTLLFILTPYAFIYKDKMEVKKNIFYDKFWYFNDIKKVSDVNKSGFVITYNDGDEEILNLSGIKASHLKDLRDELNKNVNETLERRELSN